MNNLAYSFKTILISVKLLLNIYNKQFNLILQILTMELQGSSKRPSKQNNAQLYEAYLRAALIKGPQFYSYQNYQIKINEEGNQNYEIIKKIGRGKYSDVYKCISVRDDQFYVLKILKPVRQQKIKRQIKILNHLNNDCVVKLFQILHDQGSHCNCLVFQHVQTADYRDMIDTLDAIQIKKIMKKIFEGLKYSHSQGIMHRDIKPQNLLIDPSRDIVKIADWGLAQFYLPNTEYNVRVASRHYKGPQLLLNNMQYDYSLDIWSLGLVFAGFIFRTYTIFRGDDNPDQLNEIMKHFGLTEIKQYIKKYKLKPDAPTMNHITECKQTQKRNWSHYITKQNKNLCDAPALDLLDKMLQIDHKKRINAIQALEHPYFQQLNRLQK